ncbi:Flp pilus assembly complex ATPase component TadA, partial [Patescibacteria group bacterium]|nr:Flp pilus assembly complex ATPase component TadA [Patescibacteria group bacterium]
LLTAEAAAEVQKGIQEGAGSVDALIEKQGVSLEKAYAVASEKYGIPYRNLPADTGDHRALEYIPEESARHYEFVPLEVKDGALSVGVLDPENIEALDALQFISSRVGMPYKLFLINHADFEQVLQEYENLSGEVGEALSEYEGSESIGEIGGKPNSPVETTIKADAPVTKIVATILRYAVEGGASDIHIEPSPEKTKVRFRMDGDLHTSLELPAKVHQAVIARIKILSQMRLDEKRKPQDGRFSATVEGRRIDFRVSTFPTQGGEKVVMRILDSAKSIATLETIGLSEADLIQVREIIKKPYGIVLIAGPTGSGKSTTLFSMLSELDRETANVVSVEDPVEYEITGVSQSQVRPEIGYTFAAGLRSILRQDPDIIMVGEIRDKETAQLAIQAALTGHLVFSTIHTNTAAGVIPRLVDMGVDPYLIAPTLIAAVGQRLVRRLCPGAGKAVPITESLHGMLDKQFEDLPAEFHKKLPPFESFYTANPTADCPNGTRGRLAVFEFLRMDKELEHVVLTNPVEEEVYATARSKGMITMREDAIMKALAGEIPFEEVNTLGGQIFPDDEDLG